MGLVVLTMVDVTHEETNKEIVKRRYRLAYSKKVPDSELIDFFAAHVEESKKSVPVPGDGRRKSVDDSTRQDIIIKDLSPGMRAHLPGSQKWLGR